MRLMHVRAVGVRWAQRIAVVVVLGALLAVAAGCRGKADVVVTPPPSVVPTTVASASPTPTATGTPFPTGQPGEVVTTVKDLVAKYGYPPGANYASIRIPTIGVNAQVGATTVGRDAIMAVPQGPADVVWYDLSQWEGLGGTPGGGQNAVLSGHVDYADPVPYANVAYRGQAVFSQIKLLSQGDIIEVDYQGKTLRYKVVSRQQLNYDADWASIWSSKVGTDSITLYTCGGAFNFQTREYVDRVIVRAERI